MKFVFYMALMTLLLGVAQPASAQFTIDEVDSKKESVVFKDKLKSISLEDNFFNRARYRAERQRIRRERNFLEMGGGLTGSLNSYNDPWIAVSGGDNSITLLAVFSLHHIFKKNLFSIETKFDAKMGYNRMKVETTHADGATSSNGVWFKNQDEFQIWINPAFMMSKNWSYGATIQFRSQFANGYLSRTEQDRTDLKSKFMTPAYLDISGGITYKSPSERFPIAINISPLALSATYATSSWIRRQQLDSSGNEIKPAFSYGIEDPDKSSKYEGGSSIEINFDRTFGKSGYLRYRTTLYSFYGWITDIGQENKISDYKAYRKAYVAWENGDKNIKDKPRLPIHPTVRWVNTIDIKATKYLTTTIGFQMYYNRSQNICIQTQTQLMVGLTYTFKNKPKP